MVPTGGKVMVARVNKPRGVATCEWRVGSDKVGGNPPQCSWQRFVESRLIESVMTPQALTILPCGGNLGSEAGNPMANAILIIL